MQLKSCRSIFVYIIIIYLLVVLIALKIYMNKDCWEIKPLVKFKIKVDQNGGHGDSLTVSLNRYRNNGEMEDELSQKTHLDRLANKEKSAKKRYIFSLRYYEQLTMATKNLLALTSFASYFKRHVVMPYVNNSRFSGLQSGVSMSRYNELHKSGNATEKAYKYSNLSTYFDLQHLNNLLTDHGYLTLANLEEFKTDCKQLDVVIHFLYNSADKYLERWYKLSQEKQNILRDRIRESNGYGECNFIHKSKISKFLDGMKVQKYVCVDPEIITSAEQLEKDVLQDAQCVGIVFWKGNGPQRVHFPLAPSITREIRPSNLKHNERLRQIAYSYIREVVKRPFVSVHVRMERILLWRGLRVAEKCLQKLTLAVSERRSSFNLKKIFLASDLGEFGSDTLQSHANKSDRLGLETKLLSGLEQPYVFNPRDYNLHDRGEIAIVEMHILSMGESLFTVGKGNFQEWIMDLFLYHNAEDRSFIFKVCQKLA